MHQNNEDQIDDEEEFDIPLNSNWTFCSTKFSSFHSETGDLDDSVSLNSDSSISSSEEERESDVSWIENDCDSQSDCSFVQYEETTEETIEEDEEDEENEEREEFNSKKRKRCDVSETESDCD